YVGRLAVAALHAGRGQRVAPEVGDVLDVVAVLTEPLDQLVVVGVRLGPEGLVALEDDHHVAVGGELLEVGADALHGEEHRYVMGVHRDGVGLADLLQRRYEHIAERGQHDPADDDRHGEDTDEAGDAGTVRDNRVGGSHRPGPFTSHGVRRHRTPS